MSDSPSTPVPAHIPTAQHNRWAPMIVLCLITLLASANAWHDTLIFDDKAFVGPQRFQPLDNLGDAFSRDLWGNTQSGFGLYRPLLLIGFEIENRIFGDWTRGYHAVNVLMHLAVTLSLFGFIGMLARRSGIVDRTATLVALTAALVFAVHPAHAEVVNSVFNASSMLVALATVLGLWWLLRFLPASPARAWIGFGAIYSVAIFFKESALVMPGLAVALIVILGPGNLMERIRRFLPVFWLLIPIAVYFYLRAMALASGVPEAASSEAAPSQFDQMIAATNLPDPGRVLSVLGVMGAGLKLFAWPQPLQLFYAVPRGLELIIVIAVQAALAVVALVALLRGRPAFAAGLAFYYIAMLPASRLLSMDGSSPHLSDRYLYVPSIGLVLMLAVVLTFLMGGRWKKPVLAFVLAAVTVLAAANWQRNADWQSQTGLFETDYANGNRSPYMVRMLIAEHGSDKRMGRVAELCELHPEVLRLNGQIAMRCGVALVKIRREKEGMAALEIAAESDQAWLSALLLLADIHMAYGRKEEAANQYTRLIERFEKPEQQETYRGIRLAKVYPEDPEKLAEARAHFERALEMSPGLEAALKWLEHVNGLLQDGQPGIESATPVPE
ncbi:MAG: hypothetical protein HKO99_02095 [Xanthomonadales bacterium]|nr:hypothetical protein [Xanthomonadales bacterium]